MDNDSSDVDLALNNLELDSMVTLEDEALDEHSGGYTEDDSVNTYFTDVDGCCCSYTKCYSTDCGC